MGDNDKKPVIFLAFANDYGDKRRQLPNLPEEARRLRATVEHAEGQGLCKYYELPFATIDTILDTFQKYQNDVAIFHFAGHADGEQILVESATGEAEGANAEQFAKFLGEQVGLKLVFLNGCSTQQQVEGLLNAGVDAVIATSRAIEDAEAMRFADRFYRGLTSGATLSTAYNQAVAAAQMVKSSSASKTRDTQRVANISPNHWPWVLHLRRGAEMVAQWSLPEAAGDPLFNIPDLPTVDPPTEPYRGLKRFEAAHARVFFGRDNEISKVYHLLTGDDAPVILFYGQSGIGKSSLLDAGVLPRLGNNHTIIYQRRDGARGLLGTLAAALQSTRSHDSLRAAWCQQAQEKPLIFVLDQVEEAYTQQRPTAENAPDEIDELLSALVALFGDRQSRPPGKLVLAFREEWLAEIESRIKQYALYTRGFRLQRLNHSGIVHAVEGAAAPALPYDLGVEEGLGKLIAEDLLEDPTSAVAVALQVLLTELWKIAEPHAQYQKYFSQKLYQDNLRRKRNYLESFLTDQLALLQASEPQLVESGLVLDVLYFHTSDIGVGSAIQRPPYELKARYSDKIDLVHRLIEILRNQLSLLISVKHTELDELTNAHVNGRSNGHDGSQANLRDGYATRLVHDALAPLVRQRFNQSDYPGQRARRILESRFLNDSNNATEQLMPLGEADLKLVEDGQAGMRTWNQNEQELVSKSRAARDRLREERSLTAQKLRTRARLIQVAAFVALTAAVIAVSFAVYANGQRNEASTQRNAALVALATSTVAQGEALVSAATATVAQGEAVVSAATATVAQGVAMGAAATATVAQGEAEFAAATAVAEATRADQNAVRAQQDQSRLLSNLANQQLTVDPVASLHLSEYALRKEDQPQPYTAEAEFALTQAVRAVLEKTFLRVSQTPFQPGQVAFRPAHDQVAIGGAALQLTDVSLAEPITVAQPAAGRLQIEWLPNGELLGYTNRSVALWNMQGVQLVESTDLGNGVHCAHKLPDASLVIICLPSSFYLWEYDTRLSTSAIVQSVSFTETFQLHDVVAAPNHQTLIATSLLSPTLLIRMSGGTMAVTHEMDVTLADLTFVNEHQFIGRDNNGNILLWSIDSAIDGTTLTSSTKYGETNEPAEGFVSLSERQQVMTFLASGSMVLWNLAGERLRTFNGHAARVNEIAWHPDPTSPYFASSSIDGTARIWDVADGKPVMTLYGHTSDLRSNRLDVLGLHWKDVRYLITYGRDGTLREWEVFDEFGQPLCYLTDPDGYPRCYRFSRRIPTTTLQLTSARWLADGQNIVTTDAKGLVGKLTVANKSWITATNLVSATLVPTDPQSAIYPVSLWNPEGTHTFSYFQEDSLPDELINANHNYDGVLHQFEPQIQRPGKIAGPITTAFWWEIGLLVSRKSGDTFLYPDPINKPSYRQRLSGHFGPVTQAKLFAEQRLVTADAQGNVRVYELGAQDNLSPAYTFHLDDEAAGMQSDIISLAWDHTGEQLLIVRSTLDQSTFRFIQTVILWQPVKDKILWQRNVVATNVPLAFSPDNQQIAIAIGPKLETWRADTGEPQWAKRAKDDANPIYGLRWVEGKVWPQQLAEANPATADASRPLILTWNGDGLTQFWDAESGIEVTRLHTNGPTYFVDVYEPADHPAQILTAGYTKEIAIWDAWYRNPAQLLAIAPTLMNRALSPQQQELFGIPMPTATPTPEAVAQQ